MFIFNETDLIVWKLLGTGITMRETANTVNLTLPAVCRRIKLMQQRIGGDKPLMQKVGRRVVLTDIGKNFSDKCVQALDVLKGAI